MDDDAPENLVEFSDSMTRIHEDLGMAVPEWLQ